MEEKKEWRWGRSGVGGGTRKRRGRKTAQNVIIIISLVKKENFKSPPTLKSLLQDFCILFLLGCCHSLFLSCFLFFLELNLVFALDLTSLGSGISCMLFAFIL